MVIVDFSYVRVVKHGVQQELAIPTKAILKILISFCHDASWMAEGTINLTQVTGVQFNDYRIRAYDSSIKELIPWNVSK
jgi:hypothetical protein